MHGIYRQSRGRKVDLGFCLLAKSPITHVSDDADDPHTGSTRAPEPRGSTQCIAAAPVELGGGIVDDDPQDVALPVITVVKTAPLEQRDPHGPKVCRADRDEIHFVDATVVPWLSFRK